MSTSGNGGHPKGLVYLFISEMWERFCYYGMRALLVLYLVESLFKGDSEAFVIYGAYTALVYMAPVIGGLLADKLLGYRIAVIMGGILMSIGEFAILGGDETWLIIGMGAIIVGNGYFKANISSIVGKLYEDGDPKRDSGFTIFYIGINVGALLATTVCAYVGETYGYPIGFSLAGVGMILGVIVFVLGNNSYGEVASPPNPEKLHAGWVGPLSRLHVTVLGSIAVIPVIYFLITLSMQYSWLMLVLLGGAAVYVIVSLLIGAIKEGPTWRDRMIAMIIIFVFNIVFWACFEQAGSSLTLFAKRNVDRFIGGWEMGAAQTQFFNPAYIIIFGSVFSLMWIALQKRRINPNIPLKFGMGIIQLGLGYLVVLLGGMFISEEYLVPLWTLAFLYLLHTTGELFLSPIGLSMVTKLAPKHMTGSAMGGWFLSFAFSNYVAAVLAMATGVGHSGGGDDGPPPKWADHVKTIQMAEPNIPQNAQQLLATANQLEQNLDKFVGEQEDLKKLPKELKDMASSVGPAYAQVKSELNPLFMDTTTYKGKKKILFDNLIQYYAGGVDGISGSLDKVNTAAQKLLKGEKYENVKDDIAGGVVGVGDGFALLNGKVVDRLTTDNEGFDLPNSKAGIAQFEPSYSLVASHMYWLIYVNVYTIMGVLTIVIGLILCAISKPLNNLMHGVE